MRSFQPRTVLLAPLLGLLSACTTVDVDPAGALAATASQLGEDPLSVLEQQPARFASARPGERYAAFQLGLYTQTKKEIILFSYSEQSKSFQKVLALPIAQIEQVAVESWGMFDHLKQLQIATGGVVLAINFSKSSDAIAGSLERTKPALDALTSAGVKQGRPYGRVLPNEVRDFVAPIIIPAK